MPDALDAAGVRAWSRACVALLSRHRAEVDALNVFPVPDSDTGANMLATLRAADAALETASDTGDGALPALLAVWAAGAARGAAGNSGFILSQVLRGLVDTAADATTVGTPLDGPSLARGLDAGATLARTAVVEPVEGTILTVARAAADAAARAAASAAAAGPVARSAFDAAVTALPATTDQLPALRESGVVDAGGRGLVLVLAALVGVLTGTEPVLPAVRLPRDTATGPAAAPPRWEVQYLLDLRDDPSDAPSDDGADVAARLRARLDALGDSVVVVPVDGGWKAHVHTDDAGAAIEVGVEAGRPHHITVTELRPAAPEVTPAVSPGTVGVLAVAPGPGLVPLFQREGVHVVQSPAGGLQPPSVDDITRAVTASGARELVLLPNSARVSGVAARAAEACRASGVRVAVVPTRSPVQGLAAVAVHDPGRPFDDDVVAMAEAAAATRWAEIGTATEEALTAVGICYPGDVLGLIDGEVVEIGRSLLAVAFGVLDRLLGIGGELMTVLVGADAPARTGAVLEQHVRERAVLIDVVVYDGGQLDRPVVIGVE